MSWAMEQLSLVEEGGDSDDADFVLGVVGSDLYHGLNFLMWLGIEWYGKYSMGWGGNGKSLFVLL
jgi:hypothetical protein